MNTIQHFIDGKFTSGNSTRTGKIYNPATGEESRQVSLGTKKDVDNAIAVAKKSFLSWSEKPPLQRARILFKYKEIIEKNSDEIVKLIVIVKYY